ncbi:MAG: hypothetical protein D4Q77_00060 [Methanothrix sp.]|nr:MAG: hypothetical protein D4Q77_00060 [Methanothrix sp.]
MNVKETIPSLVMIISAFVLVERHLALYQRSDYWMLISAMFLVGSLAVVMTSIGLRLKMMEQQIEASERILRVNMGEIEEMIEKRMDLVESSQGIAREEISERIYR